MCRVLQAVTLLVGDQFARLAVQATSLRRRCVLPDLNLSEIAASSLQGAPILGPDLFGGQFKRVLDEDVARLENYRKTTGDIRPRPKKSSARVTTPGPQQAAGPSRQQGRAPRKSKSHAQRKPPAKASGPGPFPNRRGRGRGRGRGPSRRGR